VPHLRVVVRTVVLVLLEPSAAAAAAAAAAAVAVAAEIAEASTLMAVEEDLVVGQGKASAVLDEVAAPCSLEEWVDHRIGGS
jgi:hypothetical protein